MKTKNEFSVVVVFGECAAQAYEEKGFTAMRSVLKNGDGMLVRKDFNTKAEVEAYIEGLEDSRGWEEFCVLDKEDVAWHPRLIKRLCEL